MFEFAWWWMLFLLPLPLIMAWLPAKKVKQTAALFVPSIAQGLPKSRSKNTSHWLTRVVAILAWACLIGAAARPQWLGEPISIPSKGRDLMIAVDLSGSMNTDDMVVRGQKVNRLVMIKSVLSDFISRRVGDKLGLILFADTAYLQAPLTYDRQTVEQLLMESQIGLVGEQTAIGDAIGLAIKRFEKKDKSNKVLVLLTDGQNTAGNITPEQANELAVHNGVTLYTIGVGADSMETQGFFSTRRINPSRDLDEGMLTELAQSTGGRYFRARDTQALQQIYATLDELEPIEGDSQQMRPLSALFHYPLALALGLTVVLAIRDLLAMVMLKMRRQ